MGMVKTATNQNGDTKTATDCPDQNGDILKERQLVKRRRELLDTVATRAEPVCLVDDLNIRLDQGFTNKALYTIIQQC